MSTLRLNSGGNLVDFRSRASTPEAIVGEPAVSEMLKGNALIRDERLKRKKSDVGTLQCRSTRARAGWRTDHGLEWNKP